MGYERPYYKDQNYFPYLFYVAFGIEDAQLEVSRERHHVDEFPEGLDFVLLQKPGNADYMDAMIGGTYGKVLASSNPKLYNEICKEEKWAVIRGEIQNAADLHYMRNTIGFVQALVEKGATAVLDLQTIQLYRPEEWTDKIFKPEFDPCSHITILNSKMESGHAWLHTRGMRKFGRPDISMNEVQNDDVDNACHVIDQLIFYGALGAFFDQPVQLHTQNQLSCIVHPEYVEDFENPDFNNSYYNILWSECELTQGN